MQFALLRMLAAEPTRVFTKEHIVQARLTHARPWWGGSIPQGSGVGMSVLLRQPHGFEGLSSYRVVLDASDLAVAQEVDARAFGFHLGFCVEPVSDVLAP